MLNIINQVSGRPWAIRSEIAAHVRNVVAKDGIASLRGLIEARQLASPSNYQKPLDGKALMFNIGAYEEDDRPAARRQGNVGAHGTVAVFQLLGAVTQRGGTDASCEYFESTDRFAASVADAAADSKIDGIILEIDSPGGEVFGVEEAWASLRESAKAKPIVAFVNSVAASAAFWLASAANEIVITPSGVIGSVGVFMLHVDASAALAQMGEKWTFVSSGKYKVEGNPAEPLSDEGKAAYQQETDRYYGKFVSGLAKGRGVTPETVREGFGQGRVVGSKEAVEQKMADSVGVFGDAVRRVSALIRERRSGGSKAGAQNNQRDFASRMLENQ